MNQFNKYAENPVFGNEETGTVFDAYTWMDKGRYRMDFSWRTKGACAVTFSDDGICWEKPVITLDFDPESGWEDCINRNCVIIVDGVYKMWYTGQSHQVSYSYIGYAESADGIHFHKVCEEPVMIPEFPWEGPSVMNPCVIYEEGIYKMWYSAGETYEPNATGYATSEDGIHWKKARINPIFTRDKVKEYENNRVGGCQVIRTGDMGYLMFYIGYKDIHTACICVARSQNGVTQWERSVLNPIISPEEGTWDCESCYKPTVIWNEKEQKWMLWYNGRRKWDEYIGYAEYDRRNLFETEDR